MSWDILSKTNLQYLLTRLKEVTDSIVRGHTIKNSSGTSMTSRDDLKFSGYLKTTDDSTNDCTVVSDEPIPITWEDYQALTDVQRSGNKYLITDYPGGGGGGGSGALNDLTDVTISSPTNGQILQYNSTNSKWANADANQWVDWKANGLIGAKNLIPFPYKYPQGYKWLNVSFSYDADGTIYLDGTATANGATDLNVDGLYLGDSEYILSVESSLNEGISVYAAQVPGWNTVATATPDTPATFTADTEHTYVISVRVEKDTVCDDDYVRPMLRHSEDIDSTWQSYAGSNLEISKRLNDAIVTGQQYGVKNIFCPTGLPVTVDDVTLSYNSDGTISVTGAKSTASTREVLISENLVLDGVYTICCLNENTQSKIKLARKRNGGSASTQLESNCYYTSQFNSSDYYQFYITLPNGPIGTTFNETLKVMFFKGLCYDTSWQPYTMTNRQLTEKAMQPQGHTIKNDSGTSLTQRDNLKFVGVYTSDDSTNNKTDVQIVREFQSVDDIEALTGEAAKGFQHIPDTVYKGRTASDIGFDKTGTSFNSTRVQDVLEEVDTALGDILYIKKGANDLTDCILFGVITGNGQNADVIIPCSYDSSISGITSVSLNVNAGIFSSNDVVYINSIKTSEITVSKTKVGLRLRIPFTSSVTANKPCVVMLNSANSITFN